VVAAGQAVRVAKFSGSPPHTKATFQSKLYCYPVSAGIISGGMRAKRRKYAMTDDDNGQKERRNQKAGLPNAEDLPAEAGWKGDARTPRASLAAALGVEP
jgi:hypothetical protein